MIQIQVHTLHYKSSANGLIEKYNLQLATENV